MLALKTIEIENQFLASQRNETKKRKISHQLSTILELSPEPFELAKLCIAHFPPLEPYTGTPLLPKKTRSSPRITLVLDLDETLGHCNTVPNPNAQLEIPVTFNGMEYVVYGNLRPHLMDFLKHCSEKFELVLFTASQKCYANELANLIDPCKSWFKYRLFRDSCIFVNGNYIKNLEMLGRDLSSTIIVDNSPTSFGYQPNNGIPIKSWFQDEKDCELPKLLAFLETLENCSDVRPHIKSAFGRLLE